MKFHGVPAIASVAYRAIMCPSRMLRRRMKSDVVQIRRKTWKNNFEGLDGAIQVHVKDGVLIVPYSGIWPCYLVTDEEDPISCPDRARPAALSRP